VIIRSRRLGAVLLLLCACAAVRPTRAAASDQASLQFTVPAPDPVQAGETISIQALAVNTGSSQWAAGSYYWVAEIYDVEYRFLTRTEQVSPTDNVPPGGVAAVTLPFSVPATATGRRFYRVYLVKDNRQLLESDYKAFQIVEKAIPPTPEAVDYRVEGNVTVSLKDSSIGHWRQVNGSTAVNMVGKLKDASYLLNANLIHAPGKVVDPYSVLFSYYAPWGRIYAGDIAPTYSQLSVNGLGLRGLMLEQNKGRFDWSVLGGQSVTSQSGTALINGRFARSIYAGRFGVALPANFKIGFNAFQSADEVGSLSSDPKSNNFRGPALAAQKNSGMGANLAWQPAAGVSVLADYQKNDYTPDTGQPAVSDTARRLEFRWDRRLFKLKAYAQRTGPHFVAFGAPSVIGDRNTYDATLGVFPASWYTLNLAGDQYTDNLANDPNKLTTTQRILNVGNAFHLPTGTDFNLSGSLNTAKGKPASALDNKTVTEGLGLTQAIKKHTVSLNVQNSQFRDLNKLAHDLDTQTLGLNANLSLPHNSIGSVGVTTTKANDKIDGSKRDSQSTSASYSRPLWPQWTGQFFGSLTGTKNTSPLFPADTSTLSLNSEFTWTVEKQMNVAFGLGYNKTKDKLVAANSVNEVVISTRYSYSF
jgi:hypothetical protein